MLVIEFYFPIQAALSVNAPRAVLNRIGCGDWSLADGKDDEDEIPVVRYTASESNVNDYPILMDWLESEGLWYIWRKGKDIQRIYYPGEEQPKSLQEIHKLETWMSQVA